jgi:hypothetical protein
MKHLLLMAALLATGACSKKSTDLGSAAPGTPAACANAAAKAVAALPAGGPGGPASEVPAKLQAIVTARCTEDKWTVATIDCYATQVHDMSGMKKCREMLPADQQQKLMTDIRTVMMSAAGGGAMPPHATGEMAPTQ